jgi:hypothetical protein
MAAPEIKNLLYDEYIKIYLLISKFVKDGECDGNAINIMPFSIKGNSGINSSTWGFVIGSFAYKFEGNVTLKKKGAVTVQDLTLTGKWTVTDTFKMDIDFSGQPGTSTNEAIAGIIFEVGSTVGTGFEYPGTKPFKVEFGWNDISTGIYFKSFKDIIWQSERSPW